jgi:hypothetical protein
MSGHHTPPDITGWREINEKAQNAKYKRYDENYEKGKAVYKGAGEHVKYKYCVPDINGDDPAKRVPVKRRTMKAFKEMQVVKFVKQLYDCDNPDKWVLNYLDKEDAGYVVYYLNARYKLKLKQ